MRQGSYQLARGRERLRGTGGFRLTFRQTSSGNFGTEHQHLQCEGDLDTDLRVTVLRETFISGPEQ